MNEVRQNCWDFEAQQETRDEPTKCRADYRSPSKNAKHENSYGNKRDNLRKHIDIRRQTAVFAINHNHAGRNSPCDYPDDNSHDEAVFECHYNTRTPLWALLINFRFFGSVNLLVGENEAGARPRPGPPRKPGTDPAGSGLDAARGPLLHWAGFGVWTGA